MPWRWLILAVVVGAAASASIILVIDYVIYSETPVADGVTVFACGVMSIAPGLGVIAYVVMRAPHDKQTRCRKCGSDLTGNESGVCPECGTEVKP